MTATFKGKRVAVLLGGLSSEREVSLESGRNCVAALRTLGYDVTEVDVGVDVAAQLVKLKPDVAFIALHGGWGENGCLQGLLEVLKIPYTGSGVMASSLAMNKVITKRIAASVGVNTAKYVLMESNTAAAFTPAFGYPCVVKPNADGSSVGVTIVKKPEQMDGAIAEAAKRGPEVIVEQYVKGQEINVAVLDGEPLGSVEIKFKGEFYDYNAKYISNETEYVVPAPISKEVEARLFEMNRLAYKALDCSGAARIDWIVDGTGLPFLLEINTLPGMTSHSLVPKIAKYRGMSFEQLVERILDGARVHS